MLSFIIATILLLYSRTCTTYVSSMGDHEEAIIILSIELPRNADGTNECLSKLKFIYDLSRLKRENELCKGEVSDNMFVGIYCTSLLKSLRALFTSPIYHSLFVANLQLCGNEV